MVISAIRKSSCRFFLVESAAFLLSDRFIGADGNIFNIMGIASKTLKENGMPEAAKEMRSRVMESGSYENALAIITEYVEPVDAADYHQGSMEMRM